MGAVGHTWPPLPGEQAASRGSRRGFTQTRGDICRKTPPTYRFTQSFLKIVEVTSAPNAGFTLTTPRSRVTVPPRASRHPHSAVAPNGQNHRNLFLPHDRVQPQIGHFLKPKTWGRPAGVTGFRQLNEGSFTTDRGTPAAEPERDEAQTWALASVTVRRGRRAKGGARAAAASTTLNQAPGQLCSRLCPGRPSPQDGTGDPERVSASCRFAR